AAAVPPATGRVVEAVVPGPRAGGEPDLPCGGLPVQDEPGAVLELHGDEAITRGDVDLLQGLEPARRPLEARVGGPEIPLLVHGRDSSARTLPRPRGDRRAAGSHGRVLLASRPPTPEGVHGSGA